MILKNDLRKRKSQGAILFLLSLCIAILLVSTVTVLWKCNRIYEDMAEKAKIPQITNLFSAAQVQKGTKIYEKLKKQKEVKDVNLEDIIVMTEDNSVKMGENGWYSSMVFLRAFPETYTMAEGGRDKDGICLPVSLKSAMKLHVGDNVTIKFMDKKVDMPITGFFEDPWLGGTLIGFKQFFVEEDTFKKLYSQEKSYHGSILGMWLKPQAGKSFASVMKSLNARTGVTSSGILYTESSMLKKGTLLMTDIFMGLIFLFGLLLFLILLITVRYILLSALEDDYREIGVFHALGYTKNSLIAGKILFVVLLTAAGGICGFAACAFTIPVLGNFALSGSGILWHGGMVVLPGVLSVTAVFVVIFLVTWCSLRKIRRISTVQAIRNGNEDIYFTRRYHFQLDKLSALPLPLRLAVKNMSVRLGQFALLVIVCGLVVFSMVSISALNENMHNIKKMAALFGDVVSDISIVDRDLRTGDRDLRTGDSALRTGDSAKRFQAFMDKAKSLDHVRLLYSADSAYMSIEGQKMLFSAVDRFTKDKNQKPLKGRFPKYENEIMITKIVGEYLGKDIGDTVEVENEGHKAKYLITGFCQSISDAGKNAHITTEGMKRLNPDFQYSRCELLLKNEAHLHKTMEQIRRLAKSENLNLKVEDVGAETAKMMDGVQKGILGVVLLFYLLAILMTGLITFLLAITLLRKQKREFSIQRSLGYPVTTLRLQFAYSFGLAGMMGAVLGTAAVFLFTNKMFSALFRFIGITQFHADVTVGGIALPIGILAGFLVLFSFWISRRIKKVGTRQLVEDA